jgi:hypothetical protein
MPGDKRSLPGDTVAVFDTPMCTRPACLDRRKATMRRNALALVAAATLTLAACSSGADAEMNASFCEASTKWGESLSAMAAQESALSSASQGVADPADPTAVGMIHQIGADLLAQASTAQAYADVMIANTTDQEVVDAIAEVNTVTVDVALAMGEDARDAEDLTAFAEALAADVEVFRRMAEVDVVSAMTVISDYAEPFCNPS